MQKKNYSDIQKKGEREQSLIRTMPVNKCKNNIELGNHHLISVNVISDW